MNVKFIPLTAFQVHLQDNLMMTYICKLHFPPEISIYPEQVIIIISPCERQDKSSSKSNICFAAAATEVPGPKIAATPASYKNW